ncbi:hypothetical protein SAMN06295912_1386 [Sphingomonas laterariae]|uniref:Uncharacterized protein n=1 Tax=Edaphosphingomonas laterariae TaxID=861865 RepID=A0A239JRL2_9SPHN|nr:hypothetical protein [Sphingomonas laterariae]SNT08152.1 hypothetical protein SAMN06295912_1386 [Sphingomonas laterariae]
MSDEHHPSPVDLPGEPDTHGRPLVWTSVTIAVATLFLGLTNAISLNGWAVELAPTETSARIVTVTESWEETTEAIGLAAPRAWLHARWKQLQALRFEGQDPAAE